MEYVCQGTPRFQLKLNCTDGWVGTPGDAAEICCAEAPTTERNKKETSRHFISGEILSAGGGLLALQRACGMQMADGDGQGIRGVGRLGCSGKIEQASHHELHLRLLGPAVSDDGRLN